MYSRGSGRRRGLRAVAALLVLLAAAGSGWGAGIGARPDVARNAPVGRPATAAEVAAWDIDVRPDFSGLPPGSGTVARGQAVGDGQCAACHGTFGESNAWFSPIVGGTTPDDARTGLVRASSGDGLQRTTMMKLSSLATLWDYIRRAKPWTAPKSLAVDDVYAACAYILHLADLVPADFVLSDANIRAADALLPNRSGMTRRHGLWSVAGRPDVRSRACMRDCGPEPAIGSELPAHARNAHGNLALQNRWIGPVRGIDTTRPPLPAGLAAAHAAGLAAAARGDAGPAALAARHGCLACHGVSERIVGPALREIAARHAGDAGAVARLEAAIRGGGSGRWGELAMPPQEQLDAAEAAALARWVAAGAPLP